MLNSEPEIILLFWGILIDGWVLINFSEFDFISEVDIKSDSLDNSLEIIFELYLTLLGMVPAPLHGPSELSLFWLSNIVDFEIFFILSDILLSSILFEKESYIISELDSFFPTIFEPDSEAISVELFVFIILSVVTMEVKTILLSVEMDWFSYIYSVVFIFVSDKKFEPKSVWFWITFEDLSDLISELSDNIYFSVLLSFWISSGILVLLFIFELYSVSISG